MKTPSENHWYMFLMCWMALNLAVFSACQYHMQDIYSVPEWRRGGGGVVGGIGLGVSPSQFFQDKLVVPPNGCPSS